MHRLGPGYKVSELLLWKRRKRKWKTYLRAAPNATENGEHKKTMKKDEKKLNFPKWISWKQHYGDVKTKKLFLSQ